MYQKIKKALALASQAIIAAPVRLPVKLVAIANYVALAVGLLEAIDSHHKPGEGEEEAPVDERR